MEPMEPLYADTVVSSGKNSVKKRITVTKVLLILITLLITNAFWTAYTILGNKSHKVEKTIDETCYVENEFQYCIVDKEIKFIFDGQTFSIFSEQACENAQLFTNLNYINKRISTMTFSLIAHHFNAYHCYFHKNLKPHFNIDCDFAKITFEKICKNLNKKL